MEYKHKKISNKRQTGSGEIEMHSSQSYGTLTDSTLLNSEELLSENSSCCKCFPSGTNVKAELKTLALTAWPVTCTNIFEFLILTESIIMCGHLSKYELDGASLANSIINALGISLALGLCTACDTLFSQTYGSAHKKRMGMYLIRACMVISIFPFFIWILHMNMEPIFLALGQEAEVSKIAANYMLYFTPGLFFSFHYLILARYMQNQDKVYPPMIIGLFGNVFNVLSQYVCIYVLEYGYVSSAVCQAITYFLIWFMELIYIIVSKLYVETWDGFKSESLCNWDHFLALAIPGMGMVAMETFCWEVGTFLSGLLGVIELGTQAVLFQVQASLWNVSFGISVAANIGVGQALGASNPSKAKAIYRIAICLNVVVITVPAVLMIACHNYLPYLFTSDGEVVSMASKIMPILALFQYIDGVSTVTNGALRGCGRQKIGVVFVLLGYYILGLPSGILLTFIANLGVMGLWLGVLIGLSITATFTIILLNTQNWKKQAELAQERIIGQTRLAVAVDDTKESTSLIVSQHRRTPSEPRSCSTDIVFLPLEHEVHGKELRNIVITRILILVFSLVCFIGGILLRVYLPQSYYKQNSTNDTILSNATQMYHDEYLVLTTLYQK